MIATRGTLFAASIALLSMATTAYAQEQTENRWEDWDVTVGLGAQYEPVSPGIDEYEVSPIPYLDVVYRDQFFLKSEMGLGAYLFRSDDDPEFAVGVALGFEGGRDEKDAPTQLDGLGDLDATPEAKIFAEYEMGPFEFEVELAQGLGGHEGLRAEFAAGAEMPVGDRFTIGAGPFISLASGQYMESFYGITTAQAARSTKYTSAYDAGSGFESAGLEVNAAYSINDQWSLVGFADYTQLLGDAADSPIVDDKGFATFGIATTYRF